MLSKKFSKTKKLSIAVITLLMAGTTFVCAQDDSGQPRHTRRPHPPTSRPPEITEGMRRGISPTPFEPSQAVQSPFEIAGRSRPEPVQPVQSTAPRIKPVQQQPRQVSQPQPIQVAKAVTKDVPETEAPPPAKQAVPKTPESMPGYIVFVAGILLLFRKSNAS